MKKVLYLTFISVFAAALNTKAQEGNIFPKGEKAANVHHTGDVWLSHASDADKTFDYSVAQAIFAPGAKLDWHMHPGGQQLLITEGTGYYQERGKPVQIVRKGDVIKCLPGIEHWHGATIESGFTYLGITGSQPTKWLDRLSEDEYKKLPKSSISNLTAEQEIIQLSKNKWQWMADKKVDTLANLFHDKSVFVHMGGSWGKERELDVIKSGDIWYKKAEIYSSSVNIIGNTAILLNDIDLVAVVGGNEVVNPFMVTEVYVAENGVWKMGSLTFSRLLRPVKLGNNTSNELQQQH